MPLKGKHITAENNDEGLKLCYPCYPVIEEGAGVKLIGLNRSMLAVDDSPISEIRREGSANNVGCL